MLAVRPIGGRTLRVEPVMGTVVSIDVRDPIDEAALDAAVAHLHAVDERFSLWKAESEMSRLARGDLALADAHPDIVDVLGLCEDLRRDSGGAFDARAHRADGLIDPTALVKGWSVDGVARILEEAGARSFAISAGGDILARGEPEPGRRWRVGVRHPADAHHVAAILEVRDLAVATSALYERGAHIADPRTGSLDAPTAIRSMTVVGPTLTWADGFATAAFVMGETGLAWVEGHGGFGALAIVDERVVWTDTVDRILVH